MSPSAGQIEVYAAQVESGLFQITKNNAPDALGDIEAGDLTGFYDAVSDKVFGLYPDTGLKVQVKMTDGDVKEAKWSPRQPKAVAA